ncbi:MAG: hypothetical protein WC692_07370 [Erythrobacter sp.]|jgi:hypothetical protein
MSRDIAALIATIEGHSKRAFRWRRGRDCVSFAAACIEAQTGRDPLADLPRWQSRREALALAREQGGLDAAVDARLGARVPPAMAKRGDIAGLPDRQFGIRLMVIEGETLVGPGTGGLERLPRSAMMIAWPAMREAADV